MVVYIPDGGMLCLHVHVWVTVVHGHAWEVQNATCVHTTILQWHASHLLPVIYSDPEHVPESGTICKLQSIHTLQDMHVDRVYLRS